MLTIHGFLAPLVEPREEFRIIVDHPDYPTEPGAQLDFLYRAQWHQPGYAKLRQQSQIFGIYDDHDFGVDNSDGYMP